MVSDRIVHMVARSGLSRLYCPPRKWWSGAPDTPLHRCFRIGDVFNIFGRSRRTGPRGPRGPRGTVRPADLDYLRQWAAERSGVEAYVEPETLVNEMSVVLVDKTGEWTRRRIGGPKGVDVIIEELGVRVYDAQSSGYPQRMRDRIERDRIIRQRLEARERRARFEERNGDGDN